MPEHYRTPASPDRDFDEVDPTTSAADVATFRAELAVTGADEAHGPI